MPVLANPTANAGGAYSILPNGSVGLAGPGRAPRRVDHEIRMGPQGDGTYPVTGASPNLSYSYLTSTLGLAPNRNGYSIRLRVTNNDADIPAGPGRAKAWRARFEDLFQPGGPGQGPVRLAGQDRDVPTDWDWDNLIDNGSNNPDGATMGTWAWDLNNDGVYDKVGTSPPASPTPTLPPWGPPPTGTRP